MMKGIIRLIDHLHQITITVNNEVRAIATVKKILHSHPLGILIVVWIENVLFPANYLGL